MKKYFFGLFAIVLAVAFSAFTKPQKFLDKRFTFVGLPNSFSDIQDVTKWVETASVTCSSNTDEKVCDITTNETYYHTEIIEGEPVIKLNVTDPGQSGDQMVILASDSHTYSSGTFRYVLSSGTTGTPLNADVN